MIVGHVMGVPLEETLLQAFALGATTGVALGTAYGVMLHRVKTRLRRR